MHYAGIYATVKLLYENNFMKENIIFLKSTVNFLLFVGLPNVETRSDSLPETTLNIVADSGGFSGGRGVDMLLPKFQNKKNRTDE